MIYWLTGNTGAGKSTLAEGFKNDYPNAVVLDGDYLREVWPGLTMRKEDRTEQNMRTCRLAKYLESQGLLVIVASICPYRSVRAQIQEHLQCRFIHVTGGRTPSDEYPYEIPENPFLTIKGNE